MFVLAEHGCAGRSHAGFHLEAAASCAAAGRLPLQCDSHSPDFAPASALYQLDAVHGNNAHPRERINVQLADGSLNQIFPDKLLLSDTDSLVLQ